MVRQFIHFLIVLLLTIIIIRQFRGSYTFAFVRVKCIIINNIKVYVIYNNIHILMYIYTVI